MTVERSTASRRSRFAKWSGAWLGTLAWVIDQQVVSMTAYASCPPKSQAFAVGVGAACVLLALFGGWQSWRVYRALSSANDTRSRTDRFIAALSVLLTCIALLTIIFGTTAGLILRCER